MAFEDAQNVPVEFQHPFVNFEGEVEILTVIEWQKAGVLRVEDGNHGNDRPRRKEFVGSGTPFVRPPDLVDGRVTFASCDRINEVALRRVRKGVGRGGDVLLTHRATVGRMAFVPEPAPVFVTNPGVTVYRVIDREAFSNRYLYYFMLSDYFQNQLQARTGDNSTFPYVALTQQRKLWIPRLPLPEQRRIAAVLGALDDKIELNRQMNQTLEEMAQALFQSWFIDFDGHDPANLVDSELGPIPRGWGVGSPLDRVILKPKLTLRKGTVATYIEMKALSENSSGIQFSEVRPFKGGSKFQQHDTLLARITPCLENGKTAFVDVLEEGEVAFGSTEFIVMRAKEGVPPEWVYCLARNEAFRSHAIANMTGSSGRQRVPESSIELFRLAVPPHEPLAAFGDLVGPTFRKIAANNREARTLAALRDALLPKLISGELRVPEAEEMVEASL